MSLDQLQQHLDTLIQAAINVRDEAKVQAHADSAEFKLSNLWQESKESVRKFISWKQVVQPVSFEGTIARAFDEKVLLEMQYCDAKGKRTTRTVKAIRFAQIRGKDCLTAWCHTRDSMRHFIIARIESLKIEGESTPSFTGVQLQSAFKESRRPTRSIRFD